MRRPDHERFVADTLLSEVPACGRDDTHIARPGLAPHQHPDAFEICLLTRGEVDWWVEDELVTLQSGQIFWTRPGEWHGGVGSVVHPSQLYWFQVRFDVPASRDSQVLAIRDDLAALPIRHFPASPRLQRAVRTLIDEHRRADGYAHTAARAALCTALVQLVREGAARDAPALSRQVRTALTWMGSRIGEPFSVPQVAAVVGLSTARLEARFRRELRCTVGEHRTRIRVHAAKSLLRDTDDSITEIAIRLGFHSSQYFATVFRQRVGLTPTAYRAQFGSRTRHSPAE